MPNDPISHHFTPVFYLNAWTVEGRITRYYRPNDMVVASPIAPKNTGYEDHLYTLQGVSPEKQEFLETRFFSPVDSCAAIVHKALLAGELNTIANQSRVEWARFMMSTQLRSPFSLGELKRLADQNMRGSLSRSDDPEFVAIRKPSDPETLYEWTEKYQPHVIENAHKQFLPALIDHEELGHYLINMHWATIDVSASSHTLLTGDRPFISTHGWKNPQAVLLFPLSPTCLWLATNAPNQTAQIMGRPRTHLVRYVNDQISKCAVDYVFGVDASHLRFVERRLRKLREEPVPGVIGKGRPGCPA